MAHADWIIDPGPGAGRIVFEGTPSDPGHAVRLRARNPAGRCGSVRIQVPVKKAQRVGDDDVADPHAPSGEGVALNSEDQGHSTEVLPPRQLDGISLQRRPSRGAPGRSAVRL